MIKIKDPADCCGCTACASICPPDAITMRPDGLGFPYPQVDTSRCTGCGACEKVCAFHPGYGVSPDLPEPAAYAARHKDMREVETSRSGAAFIALSDRILARGGVVYGAGYTDHFRVVHKRAATKAERNGFKGSKYVQSDLGNVFRQIRKDLHEGHTVLFTGTPCQVAGLNAYVGKRLREQLYLVDIVCHGVSSPYLWRDYLAFLEKRHGDRIVRVDFRDKQEFGWTAHRETYKLAKGGGKLAFPEPFYKPVMFRPSCGKCHFCNTRRPGDLTLADFWGWENTVPDMNKDDKGVSLILVNTGKGRRLFDAAKHDMDTAPAALGDCLQPNLRHPTATHPNRRRFELAYIRHGMEYVMQRNWDTGWKHTIRVGFPRKLKAAKRKLEAMTRKLKAARRLLSQYIGT